MVSEVANGGRDCRTGCGGGIVVTSATGWWRAGESPISIDVQIQTVRATTQLGLIVVAGHTAVRGTSADRTSAQCIVTKALTTIFHAGVQVALTSLKTARDGVVGVELYIESAGIGAFGVASQAIESERAGINVRTWGIRAVTIPSSEVAEERNVGAGAIDSIASTNLVDVTGACKIAIGISDNSQGPVVSAPTFLLVLRTGENVART